jgi:hypothetical protein
MKASAAFPDVRSGKAAPDQQRGGLDHATASPASTDQVEPAFFDQTVDSLESRVDKMAARIHQDFDRSDRAWQDNFRGVDTCSTSMRILALCMLSVTDPKWGCKKIIASIFSPANSTPGGNDGTRLQKTTYV